MLNRTLKVITIPSLLLSFSHPNLTHKMEPTGNLAIPTLALQKPCSTSELRRQPHCTKKSALGGLAKPHFSAGDEAFPRMIPGG